ncbi:hypothetical protein AGABI1DRAFT_115462 [Agaricus bisporus var. burnettii JB137-S8]|uniref:Uncharacterized protein n=1 Tax=Agaricus bisporus var. burnettii (strain JB137-S8 / ATCC MYA-4627 / FGSC 10392) TaxID=597362 RepID=K5X1N9_AGABU|nr:uncharacterized protein AGABI1DRAFT_115462 [Agaricus bisporus var. burnettii JB137-S8]EKM77053.1 hypothetical protein AGABI1DRAFT_115462 [Agaricus bisporus var. burnettii JB137-S8]
MKELIKLLVEMCELCWLVWESVRSSFVELEEITVQLRRHGSWRWRRRDYRQCHQHATHQCLTNASRWSLSTLNTRARQFMNSLNQYIIIQSILNIPMHSQMVKAG